MGRARKWLRSFFARKKAKEKAGDSTPNWPRETKEKRWSFRRSMGASKDLNSTEPSFSEPCHGFLDSEFDQKRHAMAVAVATAAAAEAAVVAAQAAAAVVRLTAKPNDRKTSAIEEISAIKIQSFFRSYLARKALNALKGLVKMQALVRGHLVRKQATATLRCMQVLVNAQDRARAERIRLVQDPQSTPLRLQNYRRSSPHHSFELDLNEEEHVKIVEMDLGGRTHQKFSANNSTSRRPCKADLSPHFSPNPMDFEEFLFTTSQNSPQLSAMSMPAHTSFDHYPLYPNYMANTESSRAKLRSQSAPKQRLEAYERQSSKRRQSMEGRNVQRGIRMQRSSSSSHVGFVANSYEYT